MVVVTKIGGSTGSDQAFEDGILVVESRFAIALNFFVDESCEGFCKK
jgi:hypothetical protein